MGNGKVLIMNDTGKLVLRKPDDSAPADTSTLPKALDGNVGTSIIILKPHDLAPAETAKDLAPDFGSKDNRIRQI